MKKIYIYISAIILTFGASSCNKWLDITPDNTVVEGDLFSTGEGYQNALNYIYKAMGSEELYGREMTYGFVEMLSQNYTFNPRTYGDGINIYSGYYGCSKYDYTSKDEMKNIINGIWSGAYTAIANVNNIIKNIETQDAEIFRLKELEKSLIQGEAYALRAMLHFDVLRLFAAAPITGSTESYIPYVEEFPYYGGQGNETVENILEKVEKDLLKAQELVGAYDLSSEDTESRLSQYQLFKKPQMDSYSDVFYLFRGYRLNIITIKALLARVYNYWGKHTQAREYAEAVVNFEVEGSTIFTYDQGWGIKKDRKFMKDLIFTISNIKIMDTYMGSFTAGNSMIILNKDNVKLDESGSDVRYANLVKEDGWYDNWFPLKYVALDTPADEEDVNKDMAACIKLAEMHMIIAESYAAESQWALADDNINYIRAGRKCLDEDLGITDMESFKEQLFKEVRKEFFCEGQTFFFYKKYDHLIKSDMNKSSFIIPKPDSENIF